MGVLLPQDLQAAELTAGINRFGLNLTQKLSAGDGDNLTLSAPSISFALSMAAEGAAGQTREEIYHLLNFDTPGEAAPGPKQMQLLETLLAGDTGVRLHVANSLWLQENFPFVTGFIDRARRFYGAEVDAVDFRDPATADRINSWVHEQTGGNIKQIADEDAIRELVSMILNAVYFDGQWQKEFDPDRTKPLPFYSAQKTEDTVPTMRREGNFPYLKNESLQAVSLPYGEGRFTMDLYLPAKDTPVEEFMEELEVEKIQNWQKNMRRENVEVKLPRFQIEYEENLNQILKEMEMQAAFDRHEADFSRMVRLDEITENIFIDFVKHKSYVEVDEEGTEAAAVTGIGIGVTAVEPEPPTIHFDRPFFFIIRDTRTDLHLFTGTVNNIPTNQPAN